jgi:hypothetical protein
MKAAPIRLAGSELGDSRHVCAFFHSAEEEYRTLLPFIKDGFDCGDRAFHIVAPEWRDDHHHRLGSVGIDVIATASSGQLAVHDWSDTYLEHGAFDQHAMLAHIEEQLQEGRKQGFPLSRSVGHMEWALENRQSLDELVEYESRLNYILPRYPDPVICVYDLARFGGAVVVDVLRTHPMVIIGGILRENPYFVPPDEFLLMRRAQRTGRSD